MAYCLIKILTSGDKQWGGGEQRVVIGIAVSTRGRLIVEAQTDIINYSYIMELDL